MIIEVRSLSLPQWQGTSIFINAIILHLLAYDAADVRDDDNLAIALSAQIQVSIGLIGIVRKLSVEPIVLDEQWGITPNNAQKTI